ncbi:hypothetical protein BBBOND_0305380 [Babesia bigemina]|uniref:C3H1-type domain-containing protein n=1 Tax=Babesia bigemina TaxID=5866 RepID=A0A061DDW5_BABBI|nr:hypothetical protein BBBOND_0305380 [Babesia bigemina]CDR96635.1 hypothetical protein BBBOND_0305380 [Babesia bigemina]|eukprot:XP_012768821.1 hypothetical protein BBBOND_0305380 [Babesia bigemina]
MAPQFKKLTDCPENLRESIDWLIQVRHGNGMDGIGELAKALQKLIGEAIEKAYTTNIDALLKLLDSAKSYNCCKDKVAEIGKLKDSEKIEDESLKKLLQCVEDHKTSCYNHLDHSQQKSYDEIESKLDQLKNHKESLEGLTDESQCKVLLTNLCDGLETFLGYDSKSKGYTGQGIVYSDLDRLCDGVMGFLLGVLKEVHENNNLSPYKTTLNEAVTKLKEQRYNGKKGLVAVIDPVKQGIAGWLGEVEKRNNDVTKYINFLQNDAINAATGIEKWKNQAFDEASKKHGELHNWIKSIKALSNQPYYAIHALEYVDKNLKNDLLPHITLLNNAIDTFKQNTVEDYNGLNAVASDAKFQINALENMVKQVAVEQQQICRKKLEDAFLEKIQSPIEKLNEKLKGLNGELKTWIDKAHLLVSKATAQCERIVREVQDQGHGKQKSANRTAVETAAETLRDRANVLYKAANNVTKNIDSWVRAAQSQLQQLEDAVMWDLNGVKDNLLAGFGKYLTGYVGKIQQEVKKITDYKTGLQKIEHAVKAYATDFKSEEGFGTKVKMWVEEIIEDSAYVKEKLKAYAGSKVHQGRFRQPQYTASQPDIAISKFYQDIAEVFKTMLRAEIRDAALMVQQMIDSDGGPAEKIEDNIVAIHTGCEQFASGIEAAIEKKASGIMNPMSAGFYTFAKDIAREIEKVVLENPARPDSLQLEDSLENAVRYTLAKLIASARQKAADLGWLTGEDNNQANIGKVDVSLDVATKLNEALRTATDPDSSTGKSYVEDKKALADYSVIQDISQELERELPLAIVDGSSTNKVQLTKFTSSFTNARPDGANETKKKLLTEKIKEIETKVLQKQHLGQVMSTTTNGATDDKFYSDTFQKLCEVVENKLKTLCKAVADLVTNKGDENTITPDDKRGLQNLMADMKSMLDEKYLDGKFYKLPNRLRQIQKRLNGIIGTEDDYDNSETLVGILDACGKFCGQTINEIVKDSITQIKTTVKVEVASKIASIQRSALANFAKSKEAELHNLQELIKDKNRVIAKIIRDDLESELKGMMKKMNAQKGTLDTIHGLATPSPGTPVKDNAQKFRQISTNFKSYYNTIHEHIEDQLIPKPKSSPPPPPISGGGYRARPAAPIPQPKGNPPGRVGMSAKTAPTGQQPPQTTKNLIAEYIERLKVHSDRLFGTLSAGYFSRSFATKLENLKEFLSSMRFSNFAGIGSPLFDILRFGIQSLTTELGKAYISVCDTQAYNFQWNVDKNSENCAKVFVTILGMIFEDLSTLKTECDRRFSISTISLSSDLGGLFKRYGYVVAKDSKSQDGELRRSDEMNGTAVRGRIVGDYPRVFNSSADTRHAINSLFDCLETYNQVCHLSTFYAWRQPCSVYEMLVWLAGLPYNNVYAVLLSDGLTNVLTKPKRKPIETGEDDFEVEFDDLKAYYADTYPNRVTHGDIIAALGHVCSTSYDVLATIAGHGDEFTTYAADFCTNSLNLKYPASGEECLHNIVDILRRMLPQLQYLFSRCKLSAMHGGWSQCLYGKDVTTTKWPCNNHSSDKPSTKANCQPTSPLMSYITDSLPGHQPHQLSSIGCKYDCANCPSVSRKGMPCLTPLGFRGFSGSTRKGEDICEILEKLFSNFYLSSLFCIVPKTPASLPEHYGFVLSLVEGWHSTKTSRKGLIMESIETSIGKQSIGLYDDTSKLTNALANAYGSSQTIHQDKNHLGPLVDLSSLSMNTVCQKKDAKLQCAPYLTSLCVDAYIYSTQKQSNTYLSWAIYLPWTFWDLLNNLYNAFCSINCQDWACRECLRGDKCKKGGHGVVDEDKPNNKCQCPSIVDCKGVAPTLYQYGFVFGEASTLNDKASPKTCSDFCSQLKNVLNSEYFKKLFRECDNFLYYIRFPFMTLTLALWLLSLLYLFHIMIIRLDLLHIKSHLHSPSSHRITAQSLLAAARVGKLAKLTYLQP